MAIKTQQMGVNLGTEVTHSHMLTSKEAKARARSTHPNQDEKSSSTNVFRRLGHGADMRDTLNRRHDQGQSQQLTAQNRQPVLAPIGQGEIPVEDLRCAIATMKENDVEFITVTTRLPFN